MKTFKINNNLEIACEWKKTRMAFKHKATLLKNGLEVDNTKICYQNRTWESFEFKSVIEKLLAKTNLLTERQKNNFLDRISGKASQEVKSRFSSVAIIAKMGDILCPDQKTKNDWKTRMLKAGLENKGLIMPEDWDTLDENEKGKRLDKVIEVIS